jgi:hypothetical protein
MSDGPSASALPARAGACTEPADHLRSLGPDVHPTDRPLAPDTTLPVDQPEYP